MHAVSSRVLLVGQCQYSTALLGDQFSNSVVNCLNLLTRANVLVRGSLNGLFGEICGVATEYCRISCLVCASASTVAQETALLCHKLDNVLNM